MRALNAVGVSGPSNEVLATVAQPGPPGAPSGFNYTVAGGNVRLFWNAPSTGDPPTGYRIEAGKCLKPDVSGKPRKLYSFAEAVDANGQVIKRADKPLAWGGSTTLCTRNVRFELNDHKDCAASGLTATGFAAIDLAGRPGATVRFRE